MEPFGPTKSLMVSQTLKIHAKIESMLVTLRRARGYAPAPVQIPPASGRW